MIRKIYFLLIFMLLFSGLKYSQVAPGDPNAVPVEFRFYHLLDPADKGVGINGDYNAWGAIYSCQQYEPNWWRVTLPLLPSTYAYKFVKYTDTVSQAYVTGYFTDPLNPDFGGPYMNSFIQVKDPMIYYLLPLDGSSFSKSDITFMANIAWANKSQLDVDRIKFFIDGTEIPNAKNYYDPATRKFTYYAGTMTLTEHTATLKVFTTAGDSAEETTTFTILSGIASAPHTFIFDSKSPNFFLQVPVERVDVKGTFNTEGLDAMKDSNGVFSVTKEVMTTKPEQYTYIINGGYYINDPDNPDLSSSHRTQIQKKVIARPYFTNVSPPSGQVYTSPLNSITVRAHINPSDSGYALKSNTLFALYDKKLVTPQRISSGNGYDVIATVSNPKEGRHVIEFSGKDQRNIVSTTSYFTFGIYPPGTGYHYVDGEEDNKGTGSYILPFFVPSGSCDISELNVKTNAAYDSLEISIKLKNISDYTRLGFSIVNQLDNNFVEAMQNVELKIPKWIGRGVFAILAPPSSPYFDSTYENYLFLNEEAGIRIIPDAASIASHEFKFKLAVQTLETIMGTYKNKWYFGAFSYLKDATGTLEISQALGGSDKIEDPDVYDVTFFSDNRFQERLLANWSSEEQIGGPRTAVIGADQRGYGSILPEEIDQNLGNAPEIKLYANGGELLYQPVKVKGYADVPAGTNVTVYCKSSAFTAAVDQNHEFELMLPLEEGENSFYASVVYGNNQIARSSTVVYNYIVDHKPVARIYPVVSGNYIELKADSSYDPDGKALSYNWTQDKNNPQQVTMSGSSGSKISFTLPPIDGEYYFNLKVTDADSDTGWARTVVLVSNGKAEVPDLNLWHPAWLDSSVFYCVFVRTFDASGTFRGLTSRMNELKDLGVTGIWLLPIHPSTGNMGPDNPGYAITDYMNVLSDYGTKEDFKELVRTAHQNGIRVIMDQVIQHTSDLHPFLKDANKYKQASPYYPFYMWDANNNFQYLFTWVSLPSINYAEASTRDYLIRMAKYWMQEFDIDGYRNDVAWAIDELRPDGPAFWQRWRRELKNMKPDIFLLAECDATHLNIFDKKFDLAYDWSWFNAIRNVISGTQNTSNLDAAVQFYLSDQFPKHAVPFKFLENQDEQRFIEAYGVGATQAAAIHLLTADGVPMLYAGQEVGEETNRGNIDWSDPHNLRSFYKKLIEIRKNNPALSHGDFTTLFNNSNGKVYSYLRTYGSNNVIVNVNLSENTVNMGFVVPLDKISFDSTASFYLNDPLNGTSQFIRGSDLKGYWVTLPPHSGQIYILSDQPLTNIEEKEKPVPLEFNLSQNYPNPFNPSTTIKFSLPEEAHVKISVYNILGQLVDILTDKDFSAGYHSSIWNANNFASGIYIYSIEAFSVKSGKNYNSVKKMLLLK